VVNIGRGKSVLGEHPSGVGCGFCSEQPISSSVLYINHPVMPHTPLLGHYYL